MNIEQAILSALDYENKVYELYQQAASGGCSEDGKRIFSALAKEEKGHVDYLESRLAKWQKEGVIDQNQLATIVPPREKITSASNKLQQKAREIDYSSEIKMLQQALELEKETSNFYRKIIDEVPTKAKKLFSRFIEIEEGHVLIVQAELDNLQGCGSWLGFDEFSMED